MTFQDLSGRGPKRRSLIGWGAITLAVLVIAAIPLTMYARGQFDETMTVSATTDQIGDGLTSGGDVKFRGLIVGKVDSVVVTPQGEQKVTMSIDSGQAPNIPSDVSASYAPSNILGVTGIELKGVGGGGRLRDGAQIKIGSDATDVSVTTLLRDVGVISETLTGNEVSRAIDIANRIVNAVQPLARQGFDLLNLAASRQQMPLARFIRILGETTVGVADLTGPLLGTFTNLIDNMSEYTDQKVVDGVTGSLRGLVDTVSAGGGLVKDNFEGLVTLTDFALTLGTPLGRTMGSIPPAVADARELIRRIQKSMPVQNGKVTLQLGVTLQQMPQLTSILAPIVPLATPAKPARAAAPAPARGGSGR